MKPTITSPSFIYTPDIAFESRDCRLILIIGSSYIGFAIMPLANPSVLFFAWHAEMDGCIDSLKEFYWQYAELRLDYQSVQICYDGVSLPIPRSLGLSKEEGEDLWQMKAFQPPSVTCMQDVPIWQIQLFYGVGDTIFEWARTNWPMRTYSHILGVLLCNGQHIANSSGCINVYVLRQTFFITAYNDGKLLLAQDYLYNTKEDVLFYILKICESWNLDPELVQLRLSGLIQADSQLYKELYLYIRNIEFAMERIEIGDYPPHFFLLFKWAFTCVS